MKEEEDMAARNQPCADARERSLEALSPLASAAPTTCIETIGGDPDTAIRLSFQIKVF